MALSEQNRLGHPKAKLPKPPGMKPDRALKAEGYAALIYQHGALTIQQIKALARVGKENTIRETLEQSRYAKSFQHGSEMYENGEWVKKGKQRVWVLTGESEWMIERYIYPEFAPIGFSSGTIGRGIRRNLARLLQANEIAVAARNAGERVMWFNTAYWLHRQGVQPGAPLWEKRPTILGVMHFLDGVQVGVGLYLGGTQALNLVVERTFPPELNDVANKANPLRKVFFVSNEGYQTYVNTLRNLRFSHGDVMVLPYEWSLDHPKLMVQAIRGNREAIFQPYLSKMANDGWVIENAKSMDNPYQWRLRKNGQVQFIDGLYGMELVGIYPFIEEMRMSITKSREQGRRVLLVTDEMEKKGLSKLTKETHGKGTMLEPPEIQILDQL